MAFPTVFAALVHEIGHIIFLRSASSGSDIRGVPSGFRIKPRSTLSYREEFFLYLSGSFANLALALLLWLLSLLTRRPFYEGIVANLITAISNLLPIEGYDGYGALRAVILARSNDSVSRENVLKGFSCFLIFNLCIFSLYLIDRFGGGYWIFAIFFLSMLKKMSQGLRKD